MYTLPCVCTVRCTLYTVHCTLYALHCTLYTVFSTVCTVQSAAAAVTPSPRCHLTKVPAAKGWRTGQGMVEDLYSYKLYIVHCTALSSVYCTVYRVWWRIYTVYCIALYIVWHCIVYTEICTVCGILNLFIYQARESNLVPVGFLTARFLQKL